MMATWAWQPDIIRRRIRHFERVQREHPVNAKRLAAKYAIVRWQQRLAQALERYGERK